MNKVIIPDSNSLDEKYSSNTNSINTKTLTLPQIKDSQLNLIYSLHKPALKAQKASSLPLASEVYKSDNYIINPYFALQMSLKGIIELMIRIESYYIIEYPQQGLFSFHITVFQSQGKKRVYLYLYENYAIPYQIIANPRKSR